MKWLVAPNAFKGTIEADKAAAIIKRAILAFFPADEVRCCPIADGGDGTCFLLSELLGLEKVSAMATDPLGRPMEGFFSFDSNSRTAYLDVSTVSGIKWLEEHEKAPEICSSYGTGELVLKAIQKGAEHIVMGLGGSATIDMGSGILRALGLIFLDKNGREIPVFSPGFLEKASHIQLTSKLPNIRFTFLCDVENTFFGQEGAIPVFGPQKGLKRKDLVKFEIISENFFQLLKSKSSKKLKDQKCFGAAGGIALGISSFFNTEMVPGAAYFFKAVKLREKLLASDLVITGEGRYDQQSSRGKGSHELLLMAKSMDKKIWLLTSGEEGNKSGFDHVLQLPDLDLDANHIEKTAEKQLYDTMMQNLHLATREP
ncbi:MAG: glycerate kinase [Cyclobacteriaceae bacterium]